MSDNESTAVGGILPHDVVAPLRSGAPLTRRQFMALSAAATAGGAVAACGGGGVLGGDTGATGPSPSPTPPSGVTISGNIVGIDLAFQGGLALTNGFLLINTTSKNLMVVNLGGGSFKAVSSICTHQACFSNWDYTAGTFTCLCHGSQFATSGAVTRAPASAPLPSFSAVFNATANTVTVTT